MDAIEHRSTTSDPRSGRGGSPEPARPVYFPPTGRLTVARYGAGFGHGASEWGAALRAVDWRREAWVCKRGRRGTVWRATLRLGGDKCGRDLDCVIKVEPLNTTGKLFRSLLHRTKAWRQWRGAALLRGSDIPCTPPRAILRGSGPSGRVEAFVGGWIEGPTVLERLADPELTRAERRRLAELVGRQIGRMWRGRGGGTGLFNRDHKPSNLVVLNGGPDDERNDGIAVLDTLDIARGVSRSEVEQRAMMRSLVRECIGCGVLPPMSARARVVRLAHSGLGVGRGRWRSMYRRVWAGYAAEAAGATVPDDDPLSPPVRLEDESPT